MGTDEADGPDSVATARTRCPLHSIFGIVTTTESPQSAADPIARELSAICSDVRENEPLSDHTTLRIGGPARWLARAATPDELTGLLLVARRVGIETYCIGGGSNVLASDSGYDGLVIVNGLTDICWQGDGAISVGAGVIWDDLVVAAIERCYDGFTAGSGIPGTVGGAIYGNAGAYGESVSDYLVGATVCDLDGASRDVTAADLKFKYRSSALENTSQIILDATFSLPGGDREQMRKRRRDILGIRHSKHPTVLEPTAGSFFKNIEREGDRVRLLEELGLADDGKRLAAAVLLDRVGARGQSEGGAAVSDKHANIIVNRSQATASDLLRLTRRLATAVNERFGIELETEVCRLGRFEADIEEQQMP